MILINSITICPENITITKGNWYYGACATICPTNATCKCLTWHSSNSNVASVNQSGYICGVSEGSAVIYATAQDGSGAVGFCNVTVEAPIRVSFVTVAPSTKTVNVGDTFGLSATVCPGNATDKRIRWTSCDCNIADVDYLTGCVTAKAEGTTNIYANAVDGSGVHGCCEVTVNAPIVEETINALRAIKQCYVRIDTSLTNSSILEGSDGHDIVLQIDDTVYLLDREPFTDDNNRSWYRILYDGMMVLVTAYDDSFEEITLPALAAPNGTGVTVNTGNAPGLNVRPIPSTDMDELGYFPNGATVILTNQTPQKDSNGDDWYAVYGQTANGTYTYGWCRGDHMGTYVEYATLVAMDTLTVYSGAGFNCNELGEICNGDSVQILNKECATANGYLWHKILFNDSYGYVPAENNATANFTFEMKWVALCDSQNPTVNVIKDNVEYHLLCNGDNSKALRIGTRNVHQLTEDLPVRGERLSYWNRQKWMVKSFGNEKKLFTQLDNSYYLCNNGSNDTYVSKTATDSNSKIVITPCGNSNELYEIKLANSNLYLTLVYNSSDGLYWAKWCAKNTSDQSNQVWKFVEQPTRHHHGVDSYDSISAATANVLKNNGKNFAIRYYTNSSSSEKLLTASEVTTIHNADLEIVSVYQDDGRDISSFSETEANIDAEKALELASALGQPLESAIYFAVDYSPSDTEINTIKQYFQIIKNKLSGKYKVGVYGTAKICEIIKPNYANYSWLSHSTGASSTSPEGDSDYIAYDSQMKYNIKQSEPISYNGHSFDNDTAIGPDFGQW